MADLVAKYSKEIKRKHALHLKLMVLVSLFVMIILAWSFLIVWLGVGPYAAFFAGMPGGLLAVIVCGILAARWGMI